MDHTRQRPTASGRGTDVLFITDDRALLRALAGPLKKAGHSFDGVAGPQEAMQRARHRAPNLIVLNRSPGGPATQAALSQLKQGEHTADVPLLLLNPTRDESDALVAFAMGADDVVEMPVSPDLLIARIDALLRRCAPPQRDSDRILRTGPFALDTQRHEFTVAGRPVTLTPSEFKILRAIVAARGTVVPRARLAETALSHPSAAQSRRIDVHVAAIRRKLGPDAAWIRTVRSVGFALKQPPHDDP